MQSTQIHKVIDQMITFLYRIRLWHRGDEATVKDLLIKWIYCIYYLMLPISLVMGAINSDNKDDCIFLTEVTIAVAVLSIKFSFLIWRQNQILELLNLICIFIVQDHDDFVLVNKKLLKLMKFAKVFLIAILAAACFALAIAPFIGNEKSLLFNIAFPFDWRNNEIAYLLVIAFQVSELILSIIVMFFSVMIWYLMLNCSLRYEVLGSGLTKMGRARKVSDKENQNHFLVDLKALIDNHSHIREYNHVKFNAVCTFFLNNLLDPRLINKLDSFCSDLFLIQIGTSGLCICGSTYCLAFVNQNVLFFLLILLTTVSGYFDYRMTVKI